MITAHPCRARLAALMLLVASSVGCKKHSESASVLLVGRIDVVSHGATTPSEASVREWVAARLAQLPHLSRRRTARKQHAYRLRLEYGVGHQKADRHAAWIAVEARRFGQSPESLVLRSNVASQFGAKVTPAEMQQQLRKALNAALDDLDRQANLLHAAPQQLKKALTSTDTERLLSTIDIVAYRRAREAVPQLIKLLKHTDERVADRAIGALVSIGDRRAVKALTRLAKFSDTRKMAKLLDGIGTLGGPEAESYLEFVAGGHPDDDIRDLAKEALRHARR